MRVGPGDDCAVIDAGCIALTCDLSIEDVHFRRTWLSAAEVGWRAGASALSDLAAVAAEPLAVLVSLAVTSEDAASGWAAEVEGGLRAVVREAGAGIVGGDLTRSPGPAMIDVAALGRVSSPVLRDGARAGDEVWVTGALGGAGAALALLREGRPVPDTLRATFTRPVPRWREARWLCERAELTALIDLSDGILGDAGHVAAASGVRIELEPARMPLTSDMEQVAETPEARVALALHAGEDYELLVVADADGLETLAEDFRSRFGIPLTRVGQVLEGEGVWTRDGVHGTVHRAGAGFDHFGSLAGPSGEPG